MCHERREDQPPLKSAFTTTLARRSVASWNERTNDSAIASSSSGNRWPYRSSVTLIDEWPMRDWIAFGWAPAAMASATLVCRRSWNRHDTPAGCLRFGEVVSQEARRRQRIARCIGEHQGIGPGCANDSMWAASSEAVNGEIVIERTPAAVFGSFRKNDRSSS